MSRARTKQGRTRAIGCRWGNKRNNDKPILKL